MVTIGRVKKTIIYHLLAIQEGDVSFSLNDENKRTEAVNHYLTFYKLDVHHLHYHYGFIHCFGEKIFVQYFLPENPKGTIFLQHGYMDHSASAYNLINDFTKMNVAIFCFDLPGLGLSTGARANISDFHHYVDVFSFMVHTFADQLPKPLSLVAHSTGGAIAIHHLLSKGAYRFEKVILLAPLVRSIFWHLSITSIRFLPFFPKEIVRPFPKTANNKEYLSFTKKDPLQYEKFPLQWFRALQRWNVEIETKRAIETELLVIQGTNDHIVDWRYNIHFIKRKFPNSRIRLIKNGRHHIFHETSPIIDQVLKEIKHYFSQYDKNRHENTISKTH